MAKACMLLPKHRCFVWYDPYSKRVASRLPHLAPVFSCQRWNEESGTTEDDDVQQAAFTFVQSMENRDLSRRIDVWERLAGFSIIREFPLYVLYHPSPFCIEYSQYDLTEIMPSDLWTTRFCLQLKTVDVCFLLAVICGTFDVKEKAWNI